MEDYDRINTLVQHSPTRKISLKDVERYHENEIRLRYELDLAKQLAVDNFSEAESDKARPNDHLLNNPSSHKAQRSPTEFSDDSHISDQLDPFRKFTRNDFSVGALSQVAYQSNMDILPPAMLEVKQWVKGLKSASTDTA